MGVEEFHHVHPAVIPPQVKEMMYRRVDTSEEFQRMPDFLVALRPHTVWEKTPVKLFCTVEGTPKPVVKWSEYSPQGVLLVRMFIQGK